MNQHNLNVDNEFFPSKEHIEPGLTALFLQQAERYPDHAAIISSERTLSYAQVMERAKSGAASLLRVGITNEEPVAILLLPGSEYIICELAVLLAGGTCVPLNPALPDNRLNMMLQEVHARLTVTEAAFEQRPLSTRFIKLASLPGAQPEDITLPETGVKHRSHVLFTSGTTGRPKGVEIEAGGIIRLVVNTCFMQIGRDDRVACIANPTFDASLIEVWGALLNGASLVLIAKETLLDPMLLEAVLENQAISFMLMTTSLFNFMAPRCPHAFRSLNYLLVGGETFNPHVLKMIPADEWPNHIVNAYGPTEGTTITLYHTIAAADLSTDEIPIGKPINNTEVYILDNDKHPVAEDATGEIYIGGDGLARGYVNQPELTGQKFVLAQLGENDLPTRLYASGDLGRRRRDGAIMYAGRRDNQIKLQGYRIEVEDIETQLLKSGLLLAAVACVVKKPGAESYLAAFVVPVSPVNFNHAFLSHWLKQRLPAYMLPRLHVVGSIPLNENGKADRAALADSQETAPASAEPAGEVESALLNIWQRVLDVRHATLEDEFFLLGGTSLQAARLVLEIKRRFAVRLSIQALYDAQTPRNLIGLLTQPADKTNDICTILLLDSRLPQDIAPLPSPPREWLDSDAGRVFLTGATGYTGAFVLRDLLLRPEVRQVFCLVRAGDNEKAMLRIQQNLTQYGLWNQAFSQRITALAGDIGRPRLGLDREQYRRLAAECDIIFHTASHISFIESYQSHRQANVTGVINILRLAVATTAKPLHYISTIAVTGPAGLLFPVDRLFEEDDISPYLAGMEYTLGYIQSKWVAERLLCQARERGVPLAIYRPGFMMADSKTGAGNPDDFMGRLIKGCINTGAYPLLPGDRKEFVTVDYVCAVLLAIASDNRRLGHIYHLIPPDEDQSISFNAFFELFEQCGYSLSPLPYKQWIQRLYDDPDLYSNPLMPLLPMLSEEVYDNLTVWETFKNLPRYDTGQTQAALAGNDAPKFTQTDRVLLARYLSYMKKIGFLE
ncbi:amino acid adenylation domain-containing protein [Sodalis sp. RH15]|uniref:non-ribosomal peptide synthetase n=1 Tax=Sodalis sp. RH15 TaxID=3394330 RepID=UPI0039B50C52